VKILRVVGDEVFHVGLVLFVLARRFILVNELRGFFPIFGGKAILEVQFWPGVFFVHWKNISQSNSSYFPKSHLLLKIRLTSRIRENRV
jgi:hypothetical protein